MSFSSDVKEELNQFNNFKNKNLLEAELFGYLLTGNVVNKNGYIEFITGNEFNAERLFKILFNLKIDYNPEVRGKYFITKINSDSIMTRFNNKLNNLNDEDKKNIIRGSFLGAGYVTDPEKNYHLEIQFDNKENSDYISNLCKSFGIEFKFLNNKKKFMIYIKGVEQVSLFLACIGANKAVLKLEDIRVFKEMKNNVNRIVNCETSNLNKTVNASVAQIEDINFLKKIKKFEELSPELKEIAICRLNHPESSLKELGEQLSEPIGKSGVSHRMQKIHNFAEEFRDRKEKK